MDATLKQTFAKAVEDVKTLSVRPNTETLLELYACYKQATEGDAKGSRPGMLDLVGRKKFDAWERKKGISHENAMRAYVELVRKLLGK